MSLAWSNLVHRKGRSLTAVAGVAFSVALIFLQLGFLASVYAAASHLFERLDFDIALLSPSYTSLSNAGTFPLARVQQAEGLAAVERAAPLYLGMQQWRNPLRDEDLADASGPWRALLDDPAARNARRRRRIMIVGFAPSDRVFNGVPEVDETRDELKVPDTLLIDTASRREFGPTQPGVETELGPRKVRIVGQFTIGTGLGADGLVIASDQTCCWVLGRSTAVVSLGLVKLQAGANAEATAAELNRLLPPDVRAWTRGDLVAREQRFWVRRTPVGAIILLGVIVALAVGVVFAFQVISSDITDHLRQYATLKAMGYRAGYMVRIVLRQAGIIALAGYLPGLLAAWGLYALTRRLNGIDIGLTPGRAAAVLALALGMCGLSGVLALRRALHADPADLF